MRTRNRRKFSRLGSWFLIGINLMQGACAYRYAQVHIKTSPPAVIEIYDANSGMHLGQTPLTTVLKRKRGAPRTRLNLLLRNGEGCPSYWQRFTVPNWAETAQDAADAAHENEVLFQVKKTDCPTEIQ
jgi:hypothetical protein